MRKRSLLLLGCLVAGLLTSSWALWLTRSADRIKREEFERIRPGMTVQAVEEVLGKPTGNVSNDTIIMFEGMPESFADPERFPPEKRRQWVGKENAVLVELDEHGRVSGRYFGHVNWPEGFFAKLRRRLGL
jgi:hypothetical protein